MKLVWLLNFEHELNLPMHDWFKSSRPDQPFESGNQLDHWCSADSYVQMALVLLLALIFLR